MDILNKNASARDGWTQIDCMGLTSLSIVSSGQVFCVCWILYGQQLNGRTELHLAHLETVWKGLNKMLTEMPFKSNCSLMETAQSDK